jgi:hypothetical protein
MVEREDERMQAVKIMEAMVTRAQSNREKLEKAVFKIAYPLPPET